MTGQRSTRTGDRRVDDRARTRYVDDNDERDRDRDEDQYDDRDDDDRDFDQDDEYEGDDADEGEYEEDDDGREGATRLSERRRPTSGLSAADAARTAQQHIADLIDKPSLGVTAVKPSDDGWTVSVEVLDDSRIPSSADILALYDIDVDMNGTLLSYARTGRYTRGRGDTGGGG